jgi:hypothetical protein
MSEQAYTDAVVKEAFFHGRKLHFDAVEAIHEIGHDVRQTNFMNSDLMQVQLSTRPTLPERRALDARKLILANALLGITGHEKTFGQALQSTFHSLLDDPEQTQNLTVDRRLPSKYRSSEFEARAHGSPAEGHSSAVAKKLVDVLMSLEASDMQFQGGLVLSKELSLQYTHEVFKSIPSLLEFHNIKTDELVQPVEFAYKLADSSKIAKITYDPGYGREDSGLINQPTIDMTIYDYPDNPHIPQPYPYVNLYSMTPNKEGKGKASTHATLYLDAPHPVNVSDKAGTEQLVEIYKFLTQHPEAAHPIFIGGLLSIEEYTLAYLAQEPLQLPGNLNVDGYITRMSSR